MEVFYGLEFWLVLATLICGIILLIYRFVLGKKKSSNEPMLVDYARSFFPVLLVVVVLRSFVIEPFRIPSGSMIPTLEIGDFIIVKKYAYGLRLPVINKKILETGEPERGDIVVFKYPVDPNINFIKRLVGLPGDTVEWTADKRLLINGQQVKENGLAPYPYTTNAGQQMQVKHQEETLATASGDHTHRVIIMPGMGRPGRYVVPPGHYFMMGDNRDNSSDSRFWGFMPEKYLVGQASFVWMHWNWQEGFSGLSFSRIGTTLN